MSAALSRNDRARFRSRNGRPEKSPTVIGGGMLHEFSGPTRYDHVGQVHPVGKIGRSLDRKGLPVRAGQLKSHGAAPNSRKRFESENRRAEQDRAERPDGDEPTVGIDDI